MPHLVVPLHGVNSPASPAMMLLLLSIMSSYFVHSGQDSATQSYPRILGLHTNFLLYSLLQSWYIKSEHFNSQVFQELLTASKCQLV